VATPTSTTSKIATDPRLDPRIRAFFGRFPTGTPQPSVPSREELLTEEYSPVVISVNECDPLRDEGINFYRLLLDSRVPDRARESPGTCHGTEIMPIVCPDISHATAGDIATFVSSL